MTQKPEILKALKLIEEQIEFDEFGQDIEEIVLDQIGIECFTPELIEKLEKLKKLRSLCLNDCKLKSLENFPNLPNLIRLELIDNNLPISALLYIKNINLQSLSFGGNIIKSFEDLIILKNFPELFQLDLLSCDINKLPNYREEVFKILQKLEILDNFDRKGEEIRYSEDDIDEDEEELNEKNSVSSDESKDEYEIDDCSSKEEEKDYEVKKRVKK